MGVDFKDINPKTITGRDLEILSHLASHGFATRAEIFHKFWHGSDKSNAHHRRLRVLLKYKLIEPIAGDTGSLGVLSKIIASGILSLL